MCKLLFICGCYNRWDKLEVNKIKARYFVNLFISYITKQTAIRFQCSGDLQRSARFRYYRSIWNSPTDNGHRVCPLLSMFSCKEYATPIKNYLRFCKSCLLMLKWSDSQLLFWVHFVVCNCLQNAWIQILLNT